MVIKKERRKKIMSIALACTMALGLCACGKGKQETVDVKGSDAQLAKQYVYSEKAIDLSVLGDEENYHINDMKMAGDRLYIVADVYDDGEDEIMESTLTLLSSNPDGSDMVKIELQKPAQENTEPEDVSEENADGEVEEVEESISDEETVEEDTAEDLAVEDVIADDAEDAEGDAEEVIEDWEYEEVTRYEWVEYGKVTVIGEQIYAVKSKQLEDWTDPENYISVNNISVCSWDTKGNFLWEVPIEGLNTEEKYCYVMAMMPSKDNGVTVMISGDKTCKISVDAQGNASELLDITGDISTLQNAEYVMVKEDGNILFTYHDEEWTSMYVATYDVAANVIGEAIKMPDSVSWMGYTSINLGQNDSLMISTSSGVYSYTLGDSEIKQLMSYVNSDLSIDSIDKMSVLDDTRFVASYYDIENYALKCGIFTKVNPEDIPDKKVMVIAGNYVDGELKNRAIAFNKTSETHRIVITEYDLYSTSDDYMAGYTKLNNDIISGNMPDILITEGLDSYLDSYISKGLLADVGELIAKDEELSQEKYMENVFEAYKVDGKLYQIIPNFYVQTVIGKKTIIGDRSTWTMKEMQEVLATMPEGATAFGDMTRDSFIYYMMNFGGSDFVNLAEGKCNFDSQQFIEMLEYAKTLPQELSEDYYEGEDWYINYQSQYREDRTLLMPLYISSFADMKYQINGYFGEEVTYVGFPSDSGTGAVISASESFVLSAKSDNLDAAWEFMRYYLTDEYQNGTSWGIPVSKDAFLEKTKDATCKSYWIDENGNKEEYDDYFDINGESIILEPLNQSQLDALIACIESANKRSYYNEEIEKIITEEVEAFFTDQKSAADVAKIIQSRTQIYINENM